MLGAENKQKISIKKVVNKIDNLSNSVYDFVAGCFVNYIKLYPAISEVYEELKTEKAENEKFVLSSNETHKIIEK